MLLTWLRGTGSRRPRLSPAHGAPRNFASKMKFTPRLELLEDRTLLSDGVLDPTFGVPGSGVPGLGGMPATGGLIDTFAPVGTLTYQNTFSVYPANSPASKYATAPTHQNSMVLQTIGSVSKIIVAGVSQGPTTKFSVGRFNSDGTLDTSFGVNGLATVNFPGSNSDQANAAAIQSDGSVIVAGATTVGGLSQFGVVRFTANGVLDTSFGKSGFVTIPTPGLVAAANAVVIQANGRIVVAGNAGGNFAVARVHADGLQDSDFNGNGITVFNIGETLAAAFIPPTGTVDTLTSMALQPDGQIVVAGYTNLNATKDGLNPVPIRNTGAPALTGQIQVATGGIQNLNGSITGTSGAGVSPIIVTAPNHGLFNGASVTISGVQGNTNANGTFTINVVDANNFELLGTTGNGAYTGGGSWVGTNPATITITSPGHGLITGTRSE